MPLKRYFVWVWIVITIGQSKCFFDDANIDDGLSQDTARPQLSTRLTDVDEFSDSPLERRLNLFHKKGGREKNSKTTKQKRSLQEIENKFGVYRNSRPRKFVKAGGETPVNTMFKPAFHDDDIDYFNITVGLLEKGQERIDKVRSYLTTWMKLDPKTENISVYPLEINGIKVANRFKGVYLNKLSGFSKSYYFDINFQDNLADPTPYRKERFVDINTDDDFGYGREYVHTLNKDCEGIRSIMMNVIKIACTPLINADGYVIMGTYRARIEIKTPTSFKISNRIFITEGDVQNEASQGIVQPIGTPQRPDSPFKAALKIISSTNNIGMIKDMDGPEVENRYKTCEAKIDTYNHGLILKQIQDEQAYLERVKDESWGALSEVRTREMAHIKTVDILRGAAEDINNYHIDLGVRMMNHLVDYMDKYKAYNSMSKYYKREIKITKLIDYLDYLWYLRDKELDDNYERYLRN